MFSLENWPSCGHIAKLGDTLLVRNTVVEKRGLSSRK